MRTTKFVFKNRNAHPFRGTVIVTNGDNGPPVFTADDVYRKPGHAHQAYKNQEEERLISGYLPANISGDGKVMPMVAFGRLPTESKVFDDELSGQCRDGQIQAF